MKGGQGRGTGLVSSKDKCQVICLEGRLEQDHAELHGPQEGFWNPKGTGNPIRVYRSYTRIVIQNGHSGFNVEIGLQMLCGGSGGVRSGCRSTGRMSLWFSEGDGAWNQGAERWWRRLLVGDFRVKKEGLRMSLRDLIFKSW